jgi:hypothetical protein
MESMMKIELKKLKVHRDMSQETECFSADIYIDGKYAAHVQNDGGGGCNMYHFEDRKLEQAFNAFCESLPPLPPDPQYPSLGSLEMDADLYIGGLIQQEETRKQLTRWCKKQTVFRLKGAEKGTWQIIKFPFDAKMKDGLVKKFGEKLEFIANEDIEKAVAFDR